MKRFFCGCVAIMLCAGASAHAKGKDMPMLETEAKAIIEEYLAKYEPLDQKLRQAWYEYNTTGDKKASEREAKVLLAIRKLDSDRERFAKLRGLYAKRKKIADAVLRRQVETLYLGHLPSQVDEATLAKLTDLEKRLGEAFNDYRPEVDGKKLSPVDVAHILSDSTDGAQLEKVWKAQHKVGPLIENDYRELVKLRNAIARDLGYENALALSAEIAEMDVQLLDRFYRDVVRITDKPFRKLKEEFIDPRLARRYGIAPKDLRPWHYQNAFFQEAPNAIFGKIDLDRLYAKTDSQKAIRQTVDFYASMGVDVSGIVKNSSLFPKPGKNPHAVAWFLDRNRPGSSVLIMNLPQLPKPPKASEVSTLVHELGHDINYEAVLANKQIPYLLRDPTMLTEAFAMLMENQTQTADWFAKLGVPADEAQEAANAVAQIDYVDQLIFLRWAATIHCFETSFYTNPDQDIGDLWWECKATNQLQGRPEGWKNPDALAKYHIPNVEPLYYSNYAIGRIANVQFEELFREKAGRKTSGGSFYGQRQLGDWLMRDFLAQGELYRWDEFLKMSAGRALSLDAWKRKYIGSEAEKGLYREAVAPSP